MNRRPFVIGGGVAILAGLGATYTSFRRMGSMDEYDAGVAASRTTLAAEPAMLDLLRLATFAPSGHNTQPWRFRLAENRIDILPDFTRRTPIVDPDDHHLFVSLGCAAENLAIAAREHGRPGTLRFDPAMGGAVVFDFGDGPKTRSPLYDAITRRQSTRTVYDGKPVAAAGLERLVAAAEVPGVDLVLLTDRPRMDRLRDIIIEGNSTQLDDPAFLRELKAWLRFNPRQAASTGDGLFSAASGSPNLPNWLGRPMFDLAFRAATENGKYARQIDTSSGLAIFSAQQADRDGWVQVGRACQRFALQATASGLKIAFVNQPVEVAALRPELASLIGLPGRRPDIVMRFGRASGLPFSPRRPVEAVIAQHAAVEVLR